MALPPPGPSAQNSSRRKIPNPLDATFVQYMLLYMKTMVVGHLDADCFYVSAERVRDSFLTGKPVGVLGNQGACVIAKSYEMKQAGVATAMTIWDAVGCCPDGVYVKRDFRWYEVLSKRMLEVVREYSPQVEYYSIDEFFFTLQGYAPGDLQALAEKLQRAIWERLGVPTTIGIARSRMLAKLISDSAKPFGAKAVVDVEAERRLLARLPVNEITGIAGRRARRLEPYGIKTCLDFVDADRRLIRSLLTATGEALWWELNGDPVQSVQPSRPAHKALSRGGSLGAACTSDFRVIHAWLARNLERLIEELRYHQVAAGRLTVWLSYRDGRVEAAQTNLSIPADRFDLLFDAARPCLERAWAPKSEAVRMHLIAERLTPRSSRPLSLFEPPGEKAEALADLKERINARVGRFALRSAATLYLPSIYSDGANGYDICDVRGKMCF